MDFNSNKERLLHRIVNGEINGTFEREFFCLLENVVLDMMKEEESFFGAFMIQVKRQIKYKLEWPIVTTPIIDGFKMFFNPLTFLKYNKKEMKAVIKHEIYHIMFGHYKRERVLRQKYSELAVNIALDLSINQYIKNLPMDYIRIHTIDIEYNLELKENMPCEYYADIIEASLKSRESKIRNVLKDKSEINIEKAHALWNDEGISQEIIENLSKNIAINAYKGRAPKDIERIILNYNEKAEIPWQGILKKLIPSLRAGKKTTITRRNRRQPDRLDLKGELPNNIPEIIVAIDISASMNDDDIKKIMVEILDITKNRGNEVRVIECDDEIRRIYNVKNVKDIKKRKRNNGATAFSPVFKYIKDNNLRDVILIYFTDGAGEKEITVRQINKKTIWVLIGDEQLSLTNPKGFIRRIDSESKKGEGGSAALEMVRDGIHDWAR